MINIAITAGGTEEPIDGIRKITNMSSGSLGWHCLESVINHMHENHRTDFRIHYIKSSRAITKELHPNDESYIKFIDVTNTQSVYDSVDKLMNENKIDVFIHAMAISDFSYSYTAPVVDLAEELHRAFTINKQISKEDILSILNNPECKYNKNEKISSKREIVMGLTTTPKVISLIKKKNPDTFLVGFKLVKQSNKSNLLNEAEKLRITNKCDAVFANESYDLSEANHSGILLHHGQVVAKLVGKKQIAQGIVNLAIKESMKL
ncbi:MAG: phosphopantothenoylcysteine decarboxylase [Dysgonamonadaceae bacterium]|nr:phosphopantothenoylcysteine decarboxylase [Dysgonamonadaceae bacterium]MDD4727401.1 phosphopantothenoylcysteine decarboxylase [Dysgonamonadaceae bacterium]